MRLAENTSPDMRSPQAKASWFEVVVVLVLSALVYLAVAYVIETPWLAVFLPWVVITYVSIVGPVLFRWSRVVLPARSPRTSIGYWAAETSRLSLFVGVAAVITAGVLSGRSNSTQIASVATVLAVSYLAIGVYIAARLIRCEVNMTLWSRFVTYRGRTHKFRQGDRVRIRLGYPGSGREGWVLFGGNTGTTTVSIDGESYRMPRRSLSFVGEDELSFGKPLERSGGEQRQNATDGDEAKPAPGAGSDTNGD